MTSKTTGLDTDTDPDKLLVYRRKNRFSHFKENHEDLKNIIFLLEKNLLNDVNFDFDKCLKILFKQFHFHTKKSTLAFIYRKMIWTEDRIINPYTNDYLTEKLQPFFIIKDVRSASGIVSITIITPPFGACKNDCAFCPNMPSIKDEVNGIIYDAPRSYLPGEPAVDRGLKEGFNVELQLRRRIHDLALTGNIERTWTNIKVLPNKDDIYLKKSDNIPKRFIRNSDGTYTLQHLKYYCKADVRLAGGTFSHYPIETRRNFIRDVYHACNNIDGIGPKLSLDNEIEKHIQTMEGTRVVALNIETRPDMINDKFIEEMNSYYATFVEIGVQVLGEPFGKADTILKKNIRGHGVYETLRAHYVLKSAGYKTLFHLMPDLPYATIEDDMETFKWKVKKTDYLTGLSDFYDRLGDNLNFSFIGGMLYFAISLCFMEYHSFYHFIVKFLVGFFCSFIFKYYIGINTKNYSVPFAHTSDHTKLYPCLDLPFTKIREWREKGIWIPKAESHPIQFKRMLCNIISEIPPWIRMARIFRDFEKETVDIEDTSVNFGYRSDIYNGNLGQQLHTMSKIDIKDIRSREVRHSKDYGLQNSFMKCYTYRSSQGTEYFLSIECKNSKGKDILLGLLRLRINDNDSPVEEIGNAAIIREVHVYGGLKQVGEKYDLNKPQHRGIGRFLIKNAELMAYNRGKDRIVVISAAGTVNYYKKQGYHRLGRYSSKNLSFKEYLKNLWTIISFQIIHFKHT